ncbi:hypothetical protein CEY15_08440 [Dietzia natronolimnaea]|uniref:Uncharacterized protein n=1 Tax=Dietzia natronolimnaea TaxID=161920 RepID=A0A2A2WQ32_9ACTN|nr:hypothetical protein [Dietzia natronolimnaea]MDZ4233031.1 hypothetical protein [Dietzia sp.]PAY23339.1 hypothetical protein CEY15_08440 [Dietzia natronolimnaea]
MTYRNPIERRRNRFAGAGSAAATSPMTVSSTYVRAQRVAPRSADLVASVAQLDVHTDAQLRLEIMGWIQQAYDDRAGGPLLGLFSRCYLGPPYVDHVLDTSGRILQHFAPSEPVPTGFEPARPLVRSGAYAYIEVYLDGQVIPVREDGTSGI